MRVPWRAGQVKFSPDRRTLLTVDNNGRVQRWDVATPRLLGELPPTLVGAFTVLSFPEGIPFSPDGRDFSNRQR
jgi:WD40 repeat protein